MSFSEQYVSEVWCATLTLSEEDGECKIPGESKLVEKLKILF